MNILSCLAGDGQELARNWPRAFTTVMGVLWAAKGRKTDVILQLTMVSLGSRDLTVQWSVVCLGNLWKLLWVKKLKYSYNNSKTCLVNVTDQLVGTLKKGKTNSNDTEALQLEFWGVTVDFCPSRTTSLSPTPTMCWPARGAAPTCWTRWSTPSSAGSSRCRSSASPSSTGTSCSAKGLREGTPALWTNGKSW